MRRKHYVDASWAECAALTWRVDVCTSHCEPCESVTLLVKLSRRNSQKRKRQLKVRESRRLFAARCSIDSVVGQTFDRQQWRGPMTE
jgi:hypothetical protein